MRKIVAGIVIASFLGCAAYIGKNSRGEDTLRWSPGSIVGIFISALMTTTSGALIIAGYEEKDGDILKTGFCMLPFGVAFGLLVVLFSGISLGGKPPPEPEITPPERADGVSPENNAFRIKLLEKQIKLLHKPPKEK